MAKYNIYKDNTSIQVHGYDQHFDAEDIKSLWEDHKILYRYGGIMAVWVEERKHSSPLVHLMFEDDGNIYWDSDNDIRFDAGWLDNYIATLSDLKNKLYR